ncbi:hypothetical protein AB4Y43_01530 [Paraburkholderia sp. BR10872]|uniref:hypothetical protein n=1 Tax=Paraburkholderia sp. BR10872 TaxID=3236989 RepID=UPI0034D2A159
MIRATLLCLALSGCAGSATFDVRPFRDEAGQMVCCAFHALDWRDIGSLTVDANKSADGSIVVHYTATAIGATAPITAQSQSVSAVAGAVSSAAAAAIKLAP